MEVGLYICEKLSNIGGIGEKWKEKALDASRIEGSQIVLFMYFIFMYHETKSI